jgi:hypothetical protein
LNNHRHLTHPLSHTPQLPGQSDDEAMLVKWIYIQGALPDSSLGHVAQKVHRMALWPQVKAVSFNPKMARWCIWSSVFFFWYEFLTARLMEIRACKSDKGEKD